MKRMFLGLGASMFLLFVLSFHSLADESNGNGSPQLNQPDPAGNVYQYQFQQANPMNEPGSGSSSETPPGPRNGALDGTGPYLNVTGATSFTVIGKVVSCLPGSGLEMVVCDANNVCNEFYVFGIGPTWFWESLGIERPVVDDVIQVEGYTVDYSGVSSRNIATSITYEEAPSNSIELRDDQGYPLWRGDRALRIGQASQSTP
jgi:hypothetical protein